MYSMLCYNSQLSIDHRNSTKKYLVQMEKFAKLFYYPKSS